jgi:putative polymerase
MVLMTFTGATLCVLSLIHGRVDLKNIRDLLIPLWFFWLGCNIGSTAMADGLVKRILVLVIAFAFFELFFLDAYTRVFNIYSYYIAIGNLQPVTDYVRESRLQLNGFRPEGIGRTLLPSLLDKHRISSVFIDPVSLGNFASIVAAWGLSKDRAEWKTGGLFLLAAVLLMVLADSRFALVCVMLMVIIRMGLRGRAHTIIMILPLLVVGILVVLGVGVAGPLNDDYFGRLVRSGQALVGFDTGTLLGVSSGVSFADHGYAYVFSHFGILLSLALWLAIWGLRIPDERSQRLRAFLALYVALLLCVSGTSVFALKTAGVLWFLFGCSLNAGSAAVVRS